MAAAFRVQGGTRCASRVITFDYAINAIDSMILSALYIFLTSEQISGCFRSEAFAQAFCCIRGSLSTLRKQDLAVLTTLEQALVGHFTCFLAYLNSCDTE